MKLHYTPLDQYRQNLIDFYTELPEVPEDTWPPVSSGTYISLALIKQDSIHHAGAYGRVTIRGDADDIYQDKESLVYEKAFGNLESGARLLVEGRPGSGKTTLVHKISQDWANNKLVLKHARLLILVHLRAFFSNPEVNLQNLLDSYLHDSSIKKTISKYAIWRSGLGFCFILDGLDEYLPPNGEKPFVYQLIRKKVLPKAIVIVASRPAAAARFRPIANRQVEVLGFLKKQIFDYVENYRFSDLKRKNLHQYLDQHPNVHHMCYLPIHTAMVCFLAECLDTDLPQTETEIYKDFTQSTILRSIHRCDEPSDVYLNSIEDLERPYSELYDKICKLAYEMCISVKQVAIEADIQSMFSTQDDINSLGLITVDKMAMRCGFQKLFTFLHLTFQEFLAAWYITTLEKEKQFELIEELNKAKQMQQVWKFYCGLTKFDSSCKAFKALVTNTEFGSLFKIQCAFESQQPHVCDSIIENNCLSFSDTFLSPSNFTEIAFILSNTQQNPVSKLSFDGCVFGEESVDVLVQKAGDKLSLLTTLCFHQCNLEQLKVVRYCLQLLPSLELLDISSSNLGREEIEILTKDLNHSSLQILKVGFKGSSLYSSAELPEMLAEAFVSKCSNFCNICFCGVTVGHETSNLASLPFYFYCDYPTINMINNKLCLAGIKALSIDFIRFPWFTNIILMGCGIDDKSAFCLALGLKHCNDLEVLELAFNSIGDNGAIAIAGSINCFTKLTLLNLIHNELTDSGALLLAEALEGHKLKILLTFNDKICRYDDIFQKCSDVNFHSVDISNRDLGDTGTKWLASAMLSSSSDVLQLHLPLNNLSHVGMKPLVSVLAQCSNLLVLNLSFNALGMEGAVILSEALQYCVKLHNLDVSCNYLGSDGVQFISKALKKCTNLVEVKVNSNNIRTEGTAALVEGLKHCAILQELEIRSNSIKSSGAKALAKAFSQQYWTHFYVLDVTSNGINRDGVKVLGEALSQCRSLQELYISNNCILSGDGEFLAVALRNFSGLKVLDISCNNLGSSGAIAIANALHHSTSLCALNISNNNIEQEGAQKLAEVMKHWTKISKLDLSLNNIETSGADCFADALINLATEDSTSLPLSQLNISSNGMQFNEQTIGNALQYCLNIHELNISKNYPYMDNASLKVMAESLSKYRFLQSIDISSSNLQGAEVDILVRGLVYCSRLRKLYLSDNQIGDHGAKSLAGVLASFINLRVIDISNNKIKKLGACAFFAALKHCTEVNELKLSKNCIGIEGIGELSSIIQHLKNIYVLEVSGMLMRSEGAQSLASGLKSCIKLQILCISSNNIGLDGAKALANAIQFCTQLHALDVSINPIELEGAGVFADALKYCTQLCDLNFSKCQVGLNSTFTPSFKYSHKLRKLDISGNLITPSLLWSPVCLVELHVSDCSLRPDDVRAIASVLTNLHVLNISHNPVGDDGAIALAKALRKNTKLHTLYIHYDEIDIKGVKVLAEALQSCTCLNTVDATFNLFGYEGIVALTQSLNHCTQLKY